MIGPLIVIAGWLSIIALIVLVLVWLARDRRREQELVFCVDHVTRRDAGEAWEAVELCRQGRIGARG